MLKEGDMGIHDLLEGDASLLEHGADDNSGGRRPHLPAQRSLIQVHSSLLCHFSPISPLQNMHIVALLIKFNEPLTLSTRQPRRLVISVPC
ncbi:uncharacterized protein isoform X2 [Salmo salar]|uniref:Uncharacterized protein LOC106567453 isoform X2 n=1 Tax=Salmo salar TaxID=8030 RepID=A0ABM3CS12_SALSA|nr:uncharacterized protein LOC106567453 isoform X2 [Salmo salar]XP_045549345.1 uncharacterized protein LOC106567453 isoform X2 [Salmo salar]